MKTRLTTIVRSALRVLALVGGFAFTAFDASVAATTYQLNTTGGTYYWKGESASKTSADTWWVFVSGHGTTADPYKWNYLGTDPIDGDTVYVNLTGKVTGERTLYLRNKAGTTTTTPALKSIVFYDTGYPMTVRDGTLKLNNEASEIWLKSGSPKLLFKDMAWEFDTASTTASLVFETGCNVEFDTVTLNNAVPFYFTKNSTAQGAKDTTLVFKNSVVAFGVGYGIASSLANCTRNMTFDNASLTLASLNTRVGGSTGTLYDKLVLTARLGANNENNPAFRVKGAFDPASGSTLVIDANGKSYGSYLILQTGAMPNPTYLTVKVQDGSTWIDSSGKNVKSIYDGTGHCANLGSNGGKYYSLFSPDGKSVILSITPKQWTFATLTKGYTITGGSLGTGEKVDVYTTVGATTWKVPDGVANIEYLVIGGGGAGGGKSSQSDYRYCGAGGGAGGYVHDSKSVTSGSSITITVGAGGSASSADAGGDGGVSILEIGSTSYKAYGGGGGGGHGSADSGRSGASGGGAVQQNGCSGGTATVPTGVDPQGHNGGNGGTAVKYTSATGYLAYYCGGGGGGAGEAGQSGYGDKHGYGQTGIGGYAGSGGAGLCLSITGVDIYYAGGGGGGAGLTYPAGGAGLGGGGVGATGSVAPTAGADGFGGGGGGAGGQVKDAQAGGNGGSGVVIIRYTQQMTVSASGYTGTYDGKGHKISVSVTVPSSGATIKYGTTEGSYTTTNPEYTNAGTYTVYYQVTASGYATVTGSATVKINQKSVSVTPKAASKTYGASDPTFSATVSGCLGNDTVSYTVTREAGTNVGTYDLYSSGTASQGNYTVTFNSLTDGFTISKATAPTLKVTCYSGIYDGNSHNAVTSVTGGASGSTTYYSTDNSNWSETMPTVKNVSDTKTVYVKVTNPNYNDATGNAVATVTTASIDTSGITLSGGSYEYDAQVHSLSYSGTVPSGVCVSWTDNSRKDVGSHTVTLTISPTDLANYAVSVGSRTATLAVTKSSNTFTTAPSISDWTYGGTASTPSSATKFGGTTTYTYSSSASGAYSSTVPSTAGTWYMKATSAGTSNYGSVTSDPVSFTIAKKGVTVNWSCTGGTVSGTAWRFDNAAHAPTPSLAGSLCGNDTCDITTTVSAKSGSALTDGAAKEHGSYTATASLGNANYAISTGATKDFSINGNYTITVVRRAPDSGADIQVAYVAKTTQQTITVTGLTEFGYNSGYIFGGWDDVNDPTKHYNMGSYAETSFRIVNGDTYGNFSVFRRYQAIPCNVSYDLAGGTAGSTMPTSGDFETVFAVPAPTRSGYTFAGWKASGDALSSDKAKWGKTSDPSTQLTAASVCVNGPTGTVYFKNLISNVNAQGGTVTLTATWTANTYNISFSAGDGTGGGCSPATYTFNTTNQTVALTKPTTAPTGKHFDKWSVSGGSTSLSDDTLTVKANSTGNISVTATWAWNTYTVAYDGNGATSGSTASSSHTYNTAKVLTSNGFSRTGYTFKGWSTSKTATTAMYTNGQSVSNLTATQGGTVTLYAVWEANKYTVKYDAKGGSGTMANSSHTYGTAKALTQNGYTKTGYTFKGWDTNSAGTTVVHADKASVSNLTATQGGTVTLYAVWKANTYTVTLNTNGGTGSALTGYTYGTGATLPTLTKTGCIFRGWFANSDFSGSKVKTIGKTETGDKTFYARFVKKPVSFTFDAQGGAFATANDDARIVPYGDVMTHNANVYPSDDPDCFAAISTGITLSGNYFAVSVTSSSSDSWPGQRANPVDYIRADAHYTAVRDVAEVTGTATFQGSATETNSDATKSYQSQLGSWSISGAPSVGQTFAVLAGTVRNATTYPIPYFMRSYWHVSPNNAFTVRYRLAVFAGACVAAANYAWQEPYDGYIACALPTVTRTGYTFGGWYTEPNGAGTQYTAESTATSDQTLYAKWTANGYAVTFDANRGMGTMATMDWTYGTSKNLTANAFTNPGYRFTGWNTKADGTGTAYAAGADMKNVAGNKTLYAQWAVDAYGIGYDNLFIFAEWAKNRKSCNCDNNPSAEFAVDVNAGEVTIENTRTDGKEFVTGNANSKDCSTYYHMAVDADETYVVSAQVDVQVAGTGSEAPAEMFVFFYDQDKKYTRGCYKSLSSSGTLTFEFTPQSTDKWIDMRFDVNRPGGKVKFSNITIRKKSWSNGVAYSTSGWGKTLSASASATTYGTLASPTKTGYTFDGWKVNGGSSVTASTSLPSPKVSQTLVSQWTAKTYTVNTGRTELYGTLKIAGNSVAFDGRTGTSSHSGTFDQELTLEWSASTTGWTYNFQYVKVYSGSDATGTLLAEYTSGNSATFTMQGTYYDNIFVQLSYTRTANTYTITLHDTLCGDSTFTIDYSATTPMLTPPSKTGYRFLGYGYLSGDTFTPYFGADGKPCLSSVNPDWKLTSVSDLYAGWVKQVTVPTGAAGLVYTGSSQTGVAGTSEYSVTGGTTSSKGSAGNYTATVALTQPTPVQGGVHSLEWKLADGTTSTANQSVGWSIASATLTNVSVTGGEYTYTGSPITVPTGTPSATSVNGQKVTFMYSATQNGTYTTDKLQYADAGTYDCYYQVSAPNHTTVTGKVTLKINPASVTVPTAVANLVYNGSSQTGVNNIPSTTCATASGTASGTAAGNYSATYELTSKTNYKWSDDSTTAKTVSWTIAKKPITPTVTLSKSSATYGASDWSNLPTVTVKDDSTALVSMDYAETWNSASVTGAGTYTVTVTEKSNGNYTFTAKTATYTVNTKAMTYTVDGYSGTYDGSAHGITVSVSTPSTGVTIKYGTANGTYNLGDSPTYTDAGTHKVYYQITAANHTTVTGSADVKIDPAAITAIALDKSTVPYTGTAQRPSVTSVTANGKTFANTVGWSVAYTRNGSVTEDFIEPGTIVVTVTGNKNLTGSVPANFVIESTAVVQDEPMTSGGEKIEVKVEKSWIDQAATATGKTAQKVAEDMNKTNQYGIKGWEAYAAGFDANKIDTAAAIAKPVQTNVADKVGLTLADWPTPRPSSETGVTVKYKLKGKSQNAEYEQIGDLQDNPTFLIDLSNWSAGERVRYYRIEVVYENVEGVKR